MAARAAWKSRLLLISSTLLLCFPGIDSAPEEEGAAKLYVVYMGEKKQHEDPALVTAAHHETLTSVLGSEKAAVDSMAYSYKYGFSGFAAALTESQAERLADAPGVLSVELSRPLERATTRSWDFLRLNYGRPTAPLLKRTNFGEDVIIGIIDSGIWPESRSFADDGYGPVPKRWKGACQTGVAFNSSSCNRKIIGARYYSKGVSRKALKLDYLSPRDSDGHGTHVASTAAGSPVAGASFHGVGAGLARGGAPRARLAVYKVFWGKGAVGEGNDASLLAAVDDAVHDGVDVLSISLVMREGSWGTLHAVARGVVVVYAGGNSGPAPQTVVNASPWVITVAASTVDRAFPTAVTLGNNRTIIGQSIQNRMPGQANNFHKIVTLDSCKGLNDTKYRGKILLCKMSYDQLPDGQFAEAYDSAVRTGAAGLLFSQYTTNRLEPPRPAPLSYAKLDAENANEQDYASTLSDPTAKIGPTGTTVGDEIPAPRVAFFSSRGPSSVFPAILKPDIAAPGVSILAAVRDSYVFKSGTSMATPHVSAIAALLKAAHPDWSPAAIKSAIITTASTTDRFGQPVRSEGVLRKAADPFDFGGGNIDPERAADPGLVYDTDPAEYREFHCRWHPALYCETTPPRPAYHLNLPSISIPELITEVTVERTVTNVGPAGAVYRARVEAPLGTTVRVEPARLAIGRGARRAFKVKFTAGRPVQGFFTFGSLTWDDGGRHRVRIPVAVRVVIQESYADVS